ncbi:hypothetical protein [Actinacidiphila oryziradicis]|uniref:Transposase DDE domain-containing protein n=1 Tax=Actinacidiphila oryziradicis TaxID=2571141 RepID=A0A4U0SKS6_9ACTN|nr:hypothetical protein [Actinacidiphila oryziradicis]TKA00875.1 hypothetical protein FCI23_41615 [Actinacidiphila oryziradicis]
MSSRLSRWNGDGPLPGADQVAYVDIDDTIRRTHGYAKQSVGYGYSKVKGLNALLGILSTSVLDLRRRIRGELHAHSLLLCDHRSTRRQACAPSTPYASSSVTRIAGWVPAGIGGLG